MAIVPSSKYPAQTLLSDPSGYPYGKARNVVTAGDGSGTPWEADLVNDIFGFLQALLVGAGITPSNTPDKVGTSQYLDAIAKVIEGKDFDWTGAHTFANELNYATPPTHISEINLHNAVEGTGLQPLAWTYDGQIQVPAAGALDIRIPFKVPAGVTITGVGSYVLAGGSGFTLSTRLMKRANFVTTQLGATHTLAGAASGLRAMGVTSFTEVATDDSWYWMVIASTDTTGDGRIARAHVSWNDPGPRTAVG